MKIVFKQQLKLALALIYYKIFNNFRNYLKYKKKSLKNIRNIALKVKIT